MKRALEELELLPADKLEADFLAATDRGERLSSYLVENDSITDENMRWLQLHYAPRADRKRAAAGRIDIKSDFQAAIAEADRRSAEKPESPKEEALEGLPIMKVVDRLLLYAYQASAAEMHLEPHEKEGIVRIRVDGIMHDIMRYPRTLHDPIVTRLKAMARLRTDEHFALQDGRLREVLEGEPVDIRIDIVPLLEGEKVVMRLLTDRGRHFSLESVGLSPADLEKVSSALHRTVQGEDLKKTDGMILVAGPAGSGKTTTLYGMLRVLSAPEAGIISIEDPIEYDLQGISQIQVNSRIGLTPSKALGAIVSQEHGISVIGEIKDEETAGIAIDSAMTGHLVLATLQSANAAAALSRLLDTRIEPLKIVSSVGLIIAQRLVRKICPGCVRSATMELSEAKRLGLGTDFIRQLFGKEKRITVYAGVKCALCDYTGYLGRTGIFELFEVTEPIRDLIMKHRARPDARRWARSKRPEAGRIEREAIRQGGKTLLQDGIRKVLSGMTTVEELQRTMHDSP